MKLVARILSIVLLLFAAGCTEPAARVAPTPTPTALPAVHLTVAAVPAAQGRLRQWVQRYEKEQSFIVVDVVSADAMHASEDLSTGRVDMAVLDQDLARPYSETLTATLVASEPIVVLVNAGNPLRDLTAPAVAELLSGRIMEWSQVGGAAVPVQVYLEAEPAGEVLAFAAQALPGQRLAPQAIVCSSPAAVLSSIAQDPGAVAILPASQVSGDAVQLRVDGLAPSSADYPWQIPISLVYGPNSPTSAHMFIQFVLGISQITP